jgi:hypothetical protein
MNMRKAAIRTVAPAALATVLLVLPSSWDSAQSKPKANVCELRFTACVKRCDERYHDSFEKTGRNQTLSCIDRTCAKQRDNCARDNPKSPNSPKADGSPGAKQNDAKPKKGIDGTPSGQWVPNSPAKGKGVPGVPAGGTWNPSPNSGGKAQNLKSGGRR